MKKTPRKINVALAGVGSFAKALVEGVSFYTKNPQETVGLMHPRVGPYRVADINFVAAFDVDQRKVGKPLHTAIAAGPNVTQKICAPVAYNAVVYRGPTLDGVHDALRGSFVKESDQQEANVASILRASKADVVVNLVPSGGAAATHAYARAALAAGCSFINCIPVPLAAEPKWVRQFEKQGLVLLGDDIKSQLGATMLNRILLQTLKMRGIRITKSEQENKGGNADHFNLLHRAATKEKSKRQALSIYLREGDAAPKVTFIYTGTPSGDKLVTIKIEGEIFGRVPIAITSIIKDQISINGAGVLVDAIRAAQLLANRGAAKDATMVCPFLMKSPLHPVHDTEAFAQFERVIGRNS